MVPEEAVDNVLELVFDFDFDFGGVCVVEVGDLEGAEDAVVGVDDHISAGGGEADVGDASRCESGRVHDFPGGGLDDVDPALVCASDDVVPIVGEDCGGGELFGVLCGSLLVDFAFFCVGGLWAARGGREWVFDGFAGGHVDEMWGVFVEGGDEHEARWVTGGSAL